MSEMSQGKGEIQNLAEDAVDSLFGARPEYLAAHHTSDELRSLANQSRAKYDEFETPIVELEARLRQLRTEKRIEHAKWQNYLEAVAIAQSMESAE